MQKWFETIRNHLKIIFRNRFASAGFCESTTLTSRWSTCASRRKIMYGTYGESLPAEPERSQEWIQNTFSSSEKLKCISRNSSDKTTCVWLQTRIWVCLACPPQAFQSIIMHQFCEHSRHEKQRHDSILRENQGIR